MAPRQPIGARHSQVGGNARDDQEIAGTLVVAWIRTIDENDATGDLRRIYDEERQRSGAVANILKVHSLAPEVLKAHLTISRCYACSRRTRPRAQGDDRGRSFARDRLPLLNPTSRVTSAPPHHEP